MSKNPTQRNRSETAIALYDRLNERHHRGGAVDLDFPTRGLPASGVRRLQLRESYRHQRTRLAINDRLFDLVIAPEPDQLRSWGPGCEAGELHEDFPFDQTAFIVGCWPASAKLTPEEFDPAIVRSQAVSADLDLDTDLVLNVAQNGLWFEAALMTNCDIEVAQTLARRLGQRYLLSWQPHRIHVLDSRRNSPTVGSAAWGLVKVDHLRCPMRLGGGQASRCKDPGGPWVGASIHLSAYWNAQRKLAIDVLGCDVCRQRGNAGLDVYTRSGAQFVTGLRTTIPTRSHGWESQWPERPDEGDE